MPFKINNKKEFLVTYPSDYLGNLTFESIKELFEKENQWNYIISKEKGHKKGHIHQHFHVYLKYKGENKRGFSRKGKDAEKVWDISLGKIIYKYKIQNTKIIISTN